jgi:undecaprenyl-diphosphatase
MTAGLALGLTRQAAARFSFLLSIPAILMAGGYKSIQLLALPAVDWQSIFIGIGLSALSAYACIHFFLKLLDKMGMLPFVIYRLILGIFLLYVFI